jgi:Flp pilus assembly pilin Flp
LNRLIDLLCSAIRDESGATAIEYALIASMLGLALIPVLSNTKSGVASLYVRVDSYFTDIVK